jgi:hypothetical protein
VPRGLQAILQSLRNLAGTLDEATHTGRAALDVHLRVWGAELT